MFNSPDFLDPRKIWICLLLQWVFLNHDILQYFVLQSWGDHWLKLHIPKKKPSHIKTSVDTGLCWRWNWGQKLFVGLLFTEFFLGLLGNVRIKSSSSYFYSISADCSKQRNRRKLTAERERNKRKGPGGLTWDWIDFCIVNERMWCFKSCHHYKQKQWDCSFLGLFCVIYYNLINKSRLYLFSFFP